MASSRWELWIVLMNPDLESLLLLNTLTRRPTMNDKEVYCIRISLFLCSARQSMSPARE